MSKILLLLFVLTCKQVICQDSVLVCVNCSFYDKLNNLKIIDQKYKDGLSKVIINDNQISYSQSVIIQYYLKDHPIHFKDGTGSLIFTKKYYRRYFSKLKSFDSVYYLGTKIETDYLFVLKLLFYLTEKDKVDIPEEVYIYNTLVDFVVDNDFNEQEKKLIDLLLFILNNSDRINLFSDKMSVLNICTSLYNSIKNPNKFSNLSVCEYRFN